MDFASKETMKSSPEVLALSDSEEEVFVGPVTDKEKTKAAKLSRRTQVFFPPISWKLRSSNYSANEFKESSSYHQNSSSISNETTELKRIESLFGEMGPSTPGQVVSKPSANSGSGAESPFNGYSVEISPAKETYTVPKADSLGYGYTDDSLNSLSKDSLDVDQDSLEKNTIAVCDSHDRSVVEDLYDAGEYLNARQEEHVSVPTAQKQLTLKEIEELQEQLDRFAMEIGKTTSYVQEPSEKHNNSFEAEDVTKNESPVIERDLESALNGNHDLPSPYDLNKQRLSNDFNSGRKSHPINVTKDRLEIVHEVSDVEDRSVRFSEEFTDDRSDSPRKGSTDYLSNSTQLFEELERQIEEHESVHSNHQTTYTVLNESQPDSSSYAEYIPDATYTLLSNATADHPQSNRNVDEESLNSSYQDSGTRHNVSDGDSCPEGVFNDTLEEMEMLLKYGVDYIYSKHDKCQEPVVQETEDYRPKSADSCGSNQSDRSTPGTRDRVVKSPSPKRTPLTPNKARPKVNRTPVKTPTSSKPSGGAQSSSASNPARVPRLNLAPRLAPMRSTKLDPGSKKSVRPVQKAGNETPKFKVPAKVPISVTRVPRTQSAAGTVTYSPRPNKFLNQIRSPIGVYIHNSPSPVLMTNVKPKTVTSTTPRDHEKRHRPVWENLDSRSHKVDGSENINPNVGHGLRTVHYIQAPCIKLDDHSLPKSRLPRLGDRFEKLLDLPCPQVIKHEGRVRVNPSSPQYTAAVKAVRSNLNDSTQSEAAAALDDSDEEIFVGPITDTEKVKAAQLNRKTQVFVPPTWI